jgi:hypothetical protein
MLEGMTPPKKAYSCKVRNLAAEMSKEDAIIFIKAVNDPNWPIMTLVSALRARGVDISPSPITNHRKRMCSCA